MDITFNPSEVKSSTTQKFTHSYQVYFYIVNSGYLTFKYIVVPTEQTRGDSGEENPPRYMSYKQIY